MEGRLGRTIHRAKNFIVDTVKVHLDPTEKLARGKMGYREFERRSGGFPAIMERLDVARIIGERLSPEIGEDERFRVILDGLRRYKEARNQMSKTKSNNQPK